MEGICRASHIAIWKIVGFNNNLLCRLMASKKCEIVSKSLLRDSSDLPTDNLKKFCLGLPDWCPCCIEGMAEKENVTKLLHLMLQRHVANVWAWSGNVAKKTKESEEWFSFDIITEDLAAFQKGECPANTAKSTEWAFRNFELWRIARSEAYPTEQCPADIRKVVSGCVNLSQRHASLTRPSIHLAACICYYQGFKGRSEIVTWRKKLRAYIQTIKKCLRYDL